MITGLGGGFAARALAVLHRIEDGALTLLLGAMILLAPLQLFLRNFFDTGITWADPLLRVLVLWVGLVGAVAASRGHRHISIDAMSRILSERAQAAVGVVTGLFTAVVSGLVAYHAGRFVATEREFESIAFSGIDAWLCEIVIPAAFAVMALRYLLYSVSNLTVLIGQREDAR